MKWYKYCTLLWLWHESIVIEPSKIPCVMMQAFGKIPCFEDGDFILYGKVVT